MKSKPPDKEKVRRRALKALERARAAAEAAGVELSDWEGEFLGSVEGRLKTFGKAFCDPGKGKMGEALSSLQGEKLKEIAAKAKGKPRKGLKRTQFRRGD